MPIKNIILILITIIFISCGDDYKSSDLYGFETTANCEVTDVLHNDEYLLECESNDEVVRAWSDRYKYNRGDEVQVEIAWDCEAGECTIWDAEIIGYAVLLSKMSCISGRKAV